MFILVFTNTKTNEKLYLSKRFFKHGQYLTSELNNAVTGNFSIMCRGIWEKFCKRHPKDAMEINKHYKITIEQCEHKPIDSLN